MNLGSEVLALVLGAVGFALTFPLIRDIALLLRRPAPVLLSTGTPTLLFLIPAHNEEKMIEDCVNSLTGMDYPREHSRIVVVADNCSDRTVEISQHAGVACLTRTDLDNPGKPAAISWALNQIGIETFDAVVIVDADTVVEKGFGKGFADFGRLESKAVQAYFGSRNENQNSLTRLAGLFTRIRYEFVFPAKQKAGVNCLLTGNGMCIGRELLREGWSAFSITEDLELYASFTAGGIPIHYAQKAKLLSQEAGSLKAGENQRRRWAAGRADVLRRWGHRIMTSKSIDGIQKLDALVELSTPSPIIHTVMALAVATIAFTALPDGAAWPIAIISLTSLLPFLITTSAALARHPEPGRTLWAFLWLPFYMVWRITLAVRGTLGAPLTEWRKTER